MHNGYITIVDLEKIQDPSSESEPTTPTEENNNNNNIALIRQHYQEAIEHFHQGRLEESRCICEDCLSSLTAYDDTENDGVVDEGSHLLFLNLLLLLFNVYFKGDGLEEAERMVATAAGYAKDHFILEERRTEKGKTGGKRRNASPLNLYKKRILCSTLSYNRGLLYVRRFHLLGEGEADPTELLRTALAYFTESEEDLREVVGASRQRLADVWHAMGVCHSERGDYAAALTLYTKSLELRTHFQHTVGREEEGEVELRLADTLEHIAHLYRAMAVGAPSTAAPLFHYHDSRSEEIHILQEKAHSIMEVVRLTRKERLGEGHLLYATALWGCGRTAMDLQQWTRATERWGECVALTTRLYEEGKIPLKEKERALECLASIKGNGI